MVCDLYDDGLAYVRMMGIANPIYTFAISGLEEWPDDDIVGMSLPENLHSQVDANATHIHTNDIPAVAYAYLFIDSANGVVINAAGLAPHRTVFESWGIRTSVIDS